MLRIPVITLVASLSLASCGGASKGPTAPNSPETLVAEETAAYEAAKPVFATYCGGCHIAGGAEATPEKLEHVDMTNYPFAGHHADSIATTIGHVLGIDGTTPTMPKDKPGALTGADLDRIKAWIDAYEAADKGGAHAVHDHGEHHHHHH